MIDVILGIVGLAVIIASVTLFGRFMNKLMDKDNYLDDPWVIQFCIGLLVILISCMVVLLLVGVVPCVGHWIRGLF